MAAPRSAHGEWYSTEGNKISANNSAGSEQQSGHPQMSVMNPVGNYPWVSIPPTMGSPVMNPHAMGSSGMAPPSMCPPDMYQPVMYSPGMCPYGMAPPDIAPPGMDPGLGQWRHVFFPVPPSQPVAVVPSTINEPNKPTMVAPSPTTPAPVLTWMVPQHQQPKPQPIYQVISTL